MVERSTASPRPTSKVNKSSGKHSEVGAFSAKRDHETRMTGGMSVAKMSQVSKFTGSRTRKSAKKKMPVRPKP